jgi:hypothetical protein
MRAILETERLADANIFFDGGIHECCLDVKLTEVEVHGGGYGENSRRLAIRMTDKKVLVQSKPAR